MKFKITYGEKERFVKYVDTKRDGIRWIRKYKGARNPILFNIEKVKQIVNPYKLIKRSA